MAKRPKKLRIGWADWTVKWMDDKEWKGSEDDDRCGITKSTDLEIWIRAGNGYAKQSLREILIHEILHCLYFTTNIGHNPIPKKKDEVEEFTVGALAGPLLAVIQDNPKLLRFLTEE